MHELRGTGLQDVLLKNGFNVTEDGVAYQDLDGLYRALGHAIAFRGGQMTGSEFRFLRKRLSFSQEEAGAIVGKTSQAVAKWEKGEGSVPMSDGKLLRLAWLNKFSKRDVRRALNSAVSPKADPIRGPYVFSYQDGQWVDDSLDEFFFPLARRAIDETTAFLSRVRVLKSSYTGSAAATSLRVTGDLRSEGEATT
jgi:DNA-binding transcriptional regulator YiaG